MTDLIQYIGTKIISAKPMNRQEYNDLRGWTLPADENGNDEGYLVEYPDGGKNIALCEGYVSWSPKKQFEDAYKPTSGMNFGLAVEALKKGLKVARRGWNGKGMFLYYVPENKYPASNNTLNTMAGIFPDDLVPYQAYIAMKTVQDTVVPWLASQTDILADDWVIV
jgi:hypothetical protein